MIYYILQCSNKYSGTASYNRVRLFNEALNHLGVNNKVNLLILDSKAFLIVKIFRYIKCFLQFLMIIIKCGKKDFIIVYGLNSFCCLYPLIKRRTNFIIERTEYPAILTINSISKNLKRLSLMNLKYYHYADLFITCSSYLEKYYKSFVENIFISPLIVKVDEYNKANGFKITKYPYIAYCGNLDNNKDGVPILIKSFAIFHKYYPEVRLVIIGSGGEQSLKELETIIMENQINGFVIFTGGIPHEEVSCILTNASMLTLARPNNKQAEGGIPSKVGEYLASGVPCVITRTGDLPRYLHDGVDCYLCEPDSVEVFANKMIQCYNEDPTSVVIEAKRTVMQFNYIEQAKRLLNCLEKHFNIKILIQE